MLLHKAGKQINVQVNSEIQQTDWLGYRIVFSLWFLFLFEPARLIAYYTGLNPLMWLPTILLLGAIIHWLRSALKKYNYKWFMMFLIINLLGTVVAFWEGNWGIARPINRQIFQFFMLGVLTFTFFNSYDKIRKLFLLYFLYFTYFAVWGIYSLKISPINPGMNPGARIIVPWHPWLDNRDGFGPLMVMGMVFSYYVYRNFETRRWRILARICLVLCVGGVVLSFGRGVFLSMVASVGFIWVKGKKSAASAFQVALMIGLLFGAQAVISPGSMYWESMQTIGEGTSAGTGADRWALWGFAWKEFINNPIFGVGTGNFGIAAVRIIPKEEAIKFGYTQGRLWERSPHCVLLTVLSEYGLVGVIVFVGLMIDFIRTNIANGRLAEAYSKNPAGAGGGAMPVKEAKALKNISYGLMACFVAFSVNGIFYELIYSPFFWNLIVLNRLIRIHLKGKMINRRTVGSRSEEEGVKKWRKLGFKSLTSSGA